MKLIAALKRLFTGEPSAPMPSNVVSIEPAKFDSDVPPVLPIPSGNGDTGMEAMHNIETIKDRSQLNHHSRLAKEAQARVDDWFAANGDGDFIVIPRVSVNQLNPIGQNTLMGIMDKIQTRTPKTDVRFAVMARGPDGRAVKMPPELRTKKK